MRVSPRSVEGQSKAGQPQGQGVERDAPPSTSTPEQHEAPPATQATSTSRPEWGPTGFDAATSAKKVEAPTTPAVKSPREVVGDFYAAFERKDGKAMSAIYRDDARFGDAVFKSLDGKQAGAMWRMLTKSPDLKVRHEILKVEGDVVTAKWIANYSAPVTGNPVENHITATIRVKDGKIVEHRDDFDMKRWVAQAYGGWSKLPFATPALAAVTRHFAERQLKKFIADGN